MADINDISRFRLRVVALVIATLFIVVAGRLWSVQVVKGGEYRRLADENRVKRISVGATRGLIYDRNMKPLVTNRLSFVLVIGGESMDDKKLLRRLGDLLGRGPEEILKVAERSHVDPVLPRVVARDLDPATVAYFEEHRADFRGADIRTESVRDYPAGKTAVHVLGYVAEMSDEEYERLEGDYELGDFVGKAGVERSYEEVLRGTKGAEFLEVDASGVATRRLKEKLAQPGNNLVLTIDSSVQTAAEAGLVEGIEKAKRSKYASASAGAAVVLAAKTGEVLAMASFPDYDPTVFSAGVTTEQWAEMTAEENHYPLNNRAIMSAYPPASSFKAVTALAGMAEGVIDQRTTFVCGGRWAGMGGRWVKYCWKKSGHGPENLAEALRDSCDIYFYEVAWALEQGGQEALQKWSRAFGLGSATGIDLPFEVGGRVPDAAWKKEFNRTWPENQTWFPGDTVNMAIGQGDMLVTPLQLARAYAAVADEGMVSRPKVIKQVTAADGRVLVESRPESVGNLGLPMDRYRAVETGLKLVTSRGTASSVFGDFPVPVAGKTGTAEVDGKEDFAVFAAYAPADDPKYIVAVVIEEGGSGGLSAAPVARRALEAAFGFEQDGAG